MAPDLIAGKFLGARTLVSGPNSGQDVLSDTQSAPVAKWLRRFTSALWLRVLNAHAGALPYSASRA